MGGKRRHFMPVCYYIIIMTDWKLSLDGDRIPKGKSFPSPNPIVCGGVTL